MLFFVRACTVSLTSRREDSDIWEGRTLANTVCRNGNTVDAVSSYSSAMKRSITGRTCSSSCDASDRTLSTVHS